MNDRYDINRNRIISQRSLRTFDRNVFPPNLIPTGFAGESIPRTFCIRNEIFPLVFDLYLYTYICIHIVSKFICFVPWIEYAGIFGFVRSRRKRWKNFDSFARDCKLLFIVWEKISRLMKRLWELLDTLWETTPSLITLNGNNRFVFSCESQIRYHFPVVWFQIYNRLRKKIFSKINSSISKRLFPFFTTQLSVKFDNSSAIVSNKLETIILNAWVHMIPINE